MYSVRDQLAGELDEIRSAGLFKAERVIEDDWVGSKCGWTPFAGQRATGWPIGTIVRGGIAMWEGELGKAAGEPVRFGEALPRDPLS